MKYLLCVFFALAASAGLAFAQQRTVSGTVTDETGEPMAGVVVIEGGTSNVALTDDKGRYSIQIPDSQVTLEFKFMSYKTKTVEVSSKQDKVNVSMEVDATEMEEVVVTAFATQKKINVTGAISSVNGTDLVSAPVANISNALIGNTPGVSGLQTSGEPGRNQTQLYIRGISTYGSANPLIIIDGIEQADEQAFAEFNSMDANEIASISVLKDAASTAVYGVRGANGVIIVKTKRGNEGKPTISFSGNFGITSATAIQEGTTSYEYALLRNEAIRHEQNSFAGFDSYNIYIYDDYDLWKFKNNRDYTPLEVDAMTWLSDSQKADLKNSPALFYASHDLYDELFRKAAPQYQANLNISGGTAKVKYFASFGYFNQEGITRTYQYRDANTGSDYSRFNFRTNFDIEILKNLKISVSSAGQFGRTAGPGATESVSGVVNDVNDMAARYKTLMKYVYEANPMISPGIVEGHLIDGFSAPTGSMQYDLQLKHNSKTGGINAVNTLLRSGRGILDESLLDNTIRIDHEMDYLLPNLNIHATVSYQDSYSRYTLLQTNLPTYQVRRNSVDPNVLDFYASYREGPGSYESYGYSNWNKLYVEAGVDWSQSFKKHNVSALFLGKASKYTMPGDSYHVPSGIMGFVGRVTYNYDDRYMAEVNLGYNGTEQFREGMRFGLFPAFSAGWVPTAEKWFPANDIFTFFKIRASYGEVGNDRLGDQRRFYYLPSTYNLNQSGYFLGAVVGSTPGAYYSGASEGNVGNPDITWERARKYDIGVEAKFFRDRLSMEYDYFYERRDNILTTLGIIPAIYGVEASSVPPANVGITQNRGYELLVKWEDQAGDFFYSIGGDISYFRNKIIYKAEAKTAWPWMSETGFAIGQRFGLVSDGLYDTPEELAARPYNNYVSNRVTLGDIKYRDLDGDGIINQNDMCPIGYPNYAQYHFNIRAQFAWKGFDFKILFTGSANGSFYLSDVMTNPFFKYSGNAWKWQYDGRWTAARYAAGENISFPRMTYAYDPTSNNYIMSDYWMMSTDHIKLKNIELGYTFNVRKGILSDMHIQSMRVYFNANNVYTFRNALTPFGIDPETTDGSPYIYPLTRIFNFGLTLKF